MLNYALYPNELTVDDPNDQVARPVDVLNRDLDHLVGVISGPGSILKPIETKAVIGAYWETIANYIKEGETYSDDYIYTRFTISGVFTDVDDTFSEDRHQLVANVKVKSIFDDAIRQVTLKKVDSRSSDPVIGSIYDWGSGTTNDQLTPNAAMEISGSNLKIYDNLPEEGVFFINQTDQQETKADTIRTNLPSSISLKVPDLASGNYTIEIRNTRFGGKVLKTGVLTSTLTVA